MSVIYQPAGRAREYAELACNLYVGCTHGCRYCYAPAVMRKPRAEYHASARPRPQVLEALEREATALGADPREVLFCFTCDPYQPAEQQYCLTRRALLILAERNIKAGILTKNPGLAVTRDLAVLVAGDVNFGVTLVSLSERFRQEWEPGAASVAVRLASLDNARAAGVRT